MSPPCRLDLFPGTGEHVEASSSEHFETSRRGPSTAERYVEDVQRGVEKERLAHTYVEDMLTSV